MTDKTLEDKAVEILDASQQAMGAFADKLGDLAKQYGPDVADAALQMARIDAASELVPAIIVLGMTALFGKRAFNLWLAWNKTADAYNPGPTIVAILGGAVVGVVNIASLITILDIWRWVGIFEPKLWLAKRILGL